MTTLGDLVANGILVLGDGYRAKNEELGTTGPVFLRSAYLQDSGWVLRDPDRLAQPYVRDFGAKAARFLDTVLTTKGNSLGRLGLVREEVAGAIYSPHLSFWRSAHHDKLNPRFLYYWAHSAEAQRQIKARSESTDMAPYLSLSDQLALEITCPDSSRQKAIANLLGSLDDKIELNRRMAATLEEMARALFKSWFVDFDPVRAKSEGHDTGLPADIAALFPARFRKDGVPDGWGYGSLTRLLDVNPPTPLKTGTAAPYVDMAALPSSGPSVSSYIIRDAGSGSRFQLGDTLVARITPCLENGKTALVDFLENGEIAWGSTEFIVLRPLAPMSPTWPYLLAREEPFRAHLIGAMTGSSGRQRVPHSAIGAWEMALPSTAVLTAFGKIADPLFSRTRAASVQSETLRALRDTLLPKLISGELRIKDAESAVEAA